MCCPKPSLLAEDDTEFDLRVRGLLLRLAGEGKTGICPRTPSIVSRTCKPKPAGRAPGNSIREPVHTRTVSPSVHPRPASGGATDFFLASALVHHPALRPNSSEDTRCDRPMSATHTNYVHPHLARFQLALATFAAGTPHGVLGSVALTGGPGVSRHPRTLRRTVIEHCSRTYCLTAFWLRAWAFSSHGADAIEPLTPLSRPLLFLTPRPPS